MNLKNKIKVLLFADRKAGNSLVFIRMMQETKRALEAIGVEVTNDISDSYDIAHFFAVKDLLSNESIIVKKGVPVILHAFSDYHDFDFKGDIHSPMLTKEATRLYNLVDTVLVNYGAQKVMLRHYNISSPIEVWNPSNQYELDKNSEYNRNAFRSAYGVRGDVPVVMNYGIYDSENGFDVYEALARIMPDIEFFFFGTKTGVFNSSDHYNRNKNLANLHYEEVLPFELYDSMMSSVEAFVISGRFHVESAMLRDAMKARVPVISAPNSMLFDLLIKDKTAYIDQELDEFYEDLKNIKNSKTLTEAAYDLVSEVTPEEAGAQLLDIYTDTIANSK